jgi:hypothetical protein
MGALGAKGRDREKGGAAVAATGAQIGFQIIVSISALAVSFPSSDSIWRGSWVS